MTNTTGCNGAGEKGASSNPWNIWKALGLLITFFVIAEAQDQEIGVDLCACAPGEYEFTLDFSLFCPPVNITLGDAVVDTSCLVSPFGAPEVADLIPVAVTSIDVLELNQNLEISVQENIAGTFGDGDTFSYTSLAALPGEIVNPEDIPRAIQLNIVGVNQFDESIINVYLIVFSNNCGRYPVLFEGQSAGWTRFSDLQPPNPELCPLAVSPTPNPTPGPTPGPTPNPTPGPTPNPTPAPTGITDPPATPAPTELTDPPVTPSPTPSPTPFPTFMSMSMSMSMSMDLMDLDIELIDLMSELEDGEFGRAPVMKERSGKGGQAKKQKKDIGNGSSKGKGNGSSDSMESKGSKGSKSGSGKGKGSSSTSGSKGSKGSKASGKLSKSSSGSSGKGKGHNVSSEDGKGSTSSSSESSKASKSSKDSDKLTKGSKSSSGRGAKGTSTSEDKGSGSGKGKGSVKTKIYGSKKNNIYTSDSIKSSKSQDSSSGKGSESSKQSKKGDRI